jgi:hypothetical protein
MTMAGHATVSFNTATGGANSGGGIFDVGVLMGAIAGTGGNVFGNEPDDLT